MGKISISILIVSLLVLLIVGFYFFVKPAGDMSESFIYLYHPDLDQDDDGNMMCSEEGLVPMHRSVPGEGLGLIENTINTLLSGELTFEEEETGFITDYPLEGFSLVDISLDNGHLEITFADPNSSSTGGSCRVQILKGQLTKTVLHFDEVDRVSIYPEEFFQP